MGTVLEVEPFGVDDVAAAAELLAFRHRFERERFPILPGRFEMIDACEVLIQRAMSWTNGLVARRGSHVAGFLFATDQIVDPRSAFARFAPQRGSMMFVHGHGVATAEDPQDVYAELYATMARGLIARGILDHTVHVPVRDAGVEEAWADLGFGRANVVAVRSTEPVGRGNPAVVVRRATPDDVDRVQGLIDEEARFHAGAPISRPYLAGDTSVAVREELAGSLSGDDQAWFIASVDGAEAGITTIGPGRGSPLYIPDRAAYIGDTAVLASHRGAGIGAATVDAALGWARDHDYRAVSLHYASGNVTSRTFWTGIGFLPVMRHLRRRLDERITWAVPPPNAWRDQASIPAAHGQ
jgi:GNAT superfamily N-acetyltransferase